MEVKNRFKGLDLIECLKNYGGGLWHCIAGRDQDHPQEKEMQKSKMVSEEALQIAVKRRKGKIYPLECRVPKNSKER